MADDPEHDFRITPNPVGLALSRATGAAKRFLDKGGMSYTGPGTDVHAGVPGAEAPSMGFGELFMGQAPEVLEDWAYGFPPITGSGQTTRLKPEAVDLAMMPTFGALALTKAAGKKVAKESGQALARTMGKQMDMPVDESRRAFLQNSGGAVAATALGLPLLKSLKDEIPLAVAKTATRAATKAVRMPAKDIIYKMSKDAMSQAKRDLDMWTEAWSQKGRWPNASKQRAQIEQRREVMEALGDDFDVSTTYTREQIKDIDDFLAKVPDDIDSEVAFKRLMGDPEVSRPDYGNLGSKANNDYAEISDLRQWPERAGQRGMAKSDEASEALYLLDEGDVDMWIVTGKPPKAYPEELIPHLDEGIFQEASGKISGWGSERGRNYGTEEMLDRYLNSFVKNTE